MSITGESFTIGRAIAAPPHGRRRDAMARPEAEELANSATHGVGLLLSLAGLAALDRVVGHPGATGAAVGCWVYGMALVVTFAASTLYHASSPGRAKRVLLAVDRASIYGLIAGTYTPIAMATARGPLGPWPLAAVWGLALVGMAVRLASHGRAAKSSPLSYVALGWATLVAAAVQLAADFPPLSTSRLLAGGLCYLVGLAFYTRDDRPYYHAIWHVLVLAGSICHFGLVIADVAPRVA